LRVTRRAQPGRGRPLSEGRGGRRAGMGRDVRLVCTGRGRDVRPICTEEEMGPGLESLDVRARKVPSLLRGVQRFGQSLHPRLLLLPLAANKARRPARSAAPPPPPSRTNWTRLVPPSVLTGHVSRSSKVVERVPAVKDATASKGDSAAARDGGAGAGHASARRRSVPSARPQAPPRARPPRRSPPVARAIKFISSSSFSSTFDGRVLTPMRTG
jgi:hypothetical protein